ncbi:hypothetical protein MRB53_009922 [Persea americana]|uniref:Uncharacterized protein n=1 Tax=Persea americana TaxID=3435 RepID=A0ACC2LQD0_PERAE|nr:hypothetical protein MRB53_009922 [Persea americana]
MGHCKEPKPGGDRVLEVPSPAESEKTNQRRNCSALLQFLPLWPMATNENLPPNVIKQLAKELKNLDETPPEGIKVCINDDDFSTIFADIEGPDACEGI